VGDDVCYDCHMGVSEDYAKKVADHIILVVDKYKRRIKFISMGKY